MPPRRYKRKRYKKRKRRVTKKLRRKGKKTTTKARQVKVPFANGKPKSQIVLLQDRRDYVVTDDAFYTSAGEDFPIVPSFIMRLNDPSQFWPYDAGIEATDATLDDIKGSWKRSDYNDNTHRSLPGLNYWLAAGDGEPHNGGQAAYREGNVLSTKVTITGAPVAHQHQTTAYTQTKWAIQTAKVSDHRDIEEGLVAHDHPSVTYNYMTEGRKPGRKTTFISYDPHQPVQVPKSAGFTHVINYSYANMQKGRTAMDVFNSTAANASPENKDYLKLAMMPTAMEYSLSNYRIPKMRVTIKVEMVLACSNPSMALPNYVADDSLGGDRAPMAQTQALTGAVNQLAALAQALAPA